MTPKVPQGPESGLVPAHPEDPLDLDFAALVEPSRAAASPPPAPTAEDEENALIGAKSLGAEGFHVLLTRSRQTQAPNKVVLVIDDDAPTAELAARVLRKAGYQALVASSARDAAHLMSRQGAPALMLLDVEMPDVSGFEFLRRIRQHKRYFDTPVILFTAHSSQADIVHGLQAGADGYIAKPITASALVAATKTVLGQ